MPAIATRPVGQTGLHLTELGFGGGVLGNLYAPVDDMTARAAVDAAIAAGIRYFDTAPYYGFGLGERRIGDGLRGRGDAVLSSKVGRLLVADDSVVDDRERCGFRSPMPFRAVPAYGYDAIMRSYEDSVQRLGRSRIDILYVHDIGTLTHGADDARHFDALTHGGGLRALAELRDSGAIRAFGIGVNEVAACERVMDHARLDLLMLAGRYTLLEQGECDELFARCAASGTGVVVAAPYNSGILVHGTSASGQRHYDYGEAPAAVIAHVARIEAVCDAHRVPLAAAALQFVLAHPQVVCVVPGMGSAAHVEQAVDFYRRSIPQAFWDDLAAQGLLHNAAPPVRSM